MARRRDIGIARIFYSESADSKRRPCIVMSPESYQDGEFLVVVPITTANDDYCVPISAGDANCELENGSAARADYLIRIRKEQLLICIGKISQNFHQKLVMKIKGLLED